MSQDAKPSESKAAEDPDVILCRKIADKAGQPDKAVECVTVMKTFGQDADFDKATSQLAKILGKTPQETMAIATEALGPKPPEKAKP